MLVAASSTTMSSSVLAATASLVAELGADSALREGSSHPGHEDCVRINNRRRVPATLLLAALSGAATFGYEPGDGPSLDNGVGRSRASASSTGHSSAAGATRAVHVLSGNAGEWPATPQASGTYEPRGVYTGIEPGRRCGCAFADANASFALPTTRFRCGLD